MAATTEMTPALATRTPPRAHRRPAAPGRDPWFDNAKMALVLLVVVGHTWVLLPHDTVRDHLYDYLYFWHVPAFVLVTGYLSRSFDYTPARLWQLVRTVAVPYLVFEAAMAVFRLYVGGEHLSQVFQDPHWPMWYLAALFVWRLITPVARALPATVAVAAAVGVSLAGGFWATTTLDFYRVCGLLPFFVLGLVATPERLALLRGRGARLLAVGVLVALVPLTWVFEAVADHDWLYYSYGYRSLGVGGLHALALRAGLLVVGLAGALAFLALVPRRTGWFTRLGAATLVVYLFHGFFVKGADYAGFPGWADAHPVLALPLATLAAAGLALVLAAPPVARRLADVVDPFGYAERHVRDAVALADAPAHAEVIGEALEEAIGDPGASTADTGTPTGTPTGTR